MSTSDSGPGPSGSGQGLLRASDFWRPSESIVDGAERLAEAAVAALRLHRRITISLSGVRGVTSSFANVLLLRILQEIGTTAISERVTFETDSEAQKQVLERSVAAVRQPT